MAEWQAYYEREPWGGKRHEDHGWLWFSELMALIANVNRDPNKSRAYKGEDFRPGEDDQPVDEDLAQQARLQRMRDAAEEIVARFKARHQPIVITDADR